jgi:signal transduction histidine kinase
MAYTLTLALIDGLLLPQVMVATAFYVMHLAGAIGLLIIVSGVRRWLRTPDMLPLSIGWIVLLTTLAALPSVAGNLQSSTESLALRGLPVLMLALVLVAWRYPWPQMIAFSVGAALLSCVPLLLLDPAMSPPMGPTIVVAAIQTTSFLAVGGSVALLMRQLRAQQVVLEQANQQLRQLADLREQLGASHERSRIARELHDTLAQTMSGLSIQLEGADACWEHDPPRARAIIKQAQAVVRGGLQETRRVLRALRAGPIEQHGLVAALHQLATSSAARANLRLELTLAPDLPALSEAAEQCIYRVAQEALTNAIQHANAARLWVDLQADGRSIQMLVRDDGHGFDVAHTAGADQYGLRGLRERTEALGGQLNIVSGPGHGTTIHLIIPC